MQRAQYQVRNRLSAKPTHIRPLGIWGWWVGVMTVGFGIAPAIAQVTEMAEISPTPTLPNRSVQRLSRPTLRLDNQGEAVSELQAMLTLLGYYTGPVDGVYRETTQAAVAQFQQTVGLVADGVVGPATWSLLLPITPAQANPPAAPTETANPPISGIESGAIPNLESSIPEPNIESPESTQPIPSQPTNATAANQAEQTSPVELPTLRPGMHGAAIEQLQERLQVLGVYSGSVDGVFGPETESAVKQAQRNNNLQPDGIVGPDTWRALLR